MRRLTNRMRRRCCAAGPSRGGILGDGDCVRGVCAVGDVRMLVWVCGSAVVGMRCVWMEVRGTSWLRGEFYGGEGMGFLVSGDGEGAMGLGELGVVRKERS